MESPEGHRPSDLLNGARSVVVFGGGKLNIGAYKSPVAYIPGYIASVKDQSMRRLAFKLADFIEKRFGYYAIFSPRGVSGSVEPIFDDQLAAIKAGLGTRAIAGYSVLNKKYGFLHYSSVITSMQLEPDPPLDLPVCPAPECVEMWEKSKTTPCLKVGSLFMKAELENGKIKSIEFNKILYDTISESSSTTAFQKILLEALNEPDPSKKKSMILGDFFSRTIRSLAYSYNLTSTFVECQRVCPVEQRSYGKAWVDKVEGEV